MRRIQTLQFSRCCRNYNIGGGGFEAETQSANFLKGPLFSDQKKVSYSAGAPKKGQMVQKRPLAYNDTQSPYLEKGQIIPGVLLCTKKKKVLQC